MMLADLGADVVKIENPAGGDSFRGEGYSARFTAYNRGKRSVALDLTREDGRRALLALVAGSDVLVDNFRPGVMERLGLGWDVLHAANRRLISCSITGFGGDGPYRDRPAFDAVGLAISGMAGLFLAPDDPQLLGPTVADNLTAMYACYGILGALYERERSGLGRRVEVNMLESSIAFMPDAFANALERDVDRFTRVAASQSYALACSDGELIAIQLSTQEKFWRGLLEAAERPQLADDPRFASRADRVRNYLALRDELRPIFAQRTRGVWMERLERYDVPFAPIYALSEVPDDPQVRHLGTFYEMQHPQEGTIRGIRRPVRIDGRREGAERPPPMLGEHTTELISTLEGRL
jgi:formyl-CoA transferase